MNTVLKSEQVNLRNATDEMVVNFVQGEFEADFDQHPQFAEHLEDIDELVCSKAELIEAMRLAPSSIQWARLKGIMDMREHIAMVTGRGFI
jgi:hypothetical protein